MFSYGLVYIVIVLVIRGALTEILIVGYGLLYGKIHKLLCRKQILVTAYESRSDKALRWLVCTLAATIGNETEFSSVPPFCDNALIRESRLKQNGF